MSRNVIGIALALTIVGGLPIANSATAEGPKLQSNGANSRAVRMDGCPYYPSPVFCRGASTTHTNSRTQTPTDVDQHKPRSPA
jgi:hypothetical protein